MVRRLIVAAGLGRQLRRREVERGESKLGDPVCLSCGLEADCVTEHSLRFRPQA